MSDQAAKPSELYCRLLGDGWAKLPAAIRSAHATGGRLAGTFRIDRGRTLISRLIARLSRLPRESANAAVELNVSETDEGERWERRFGGVPMVTWQWMTDDGLLAERFHGWDLAFELLAVESSLVYHQRRAYLKLGPLPIRVPLALAPRVRATETCVGDGVVGVEVHVSLPLFGLLISYLGRLDTGGSTP